MLETCLALLLSKLIITKVFNKFLSVFREDRIKIFVGIHMGLKINSNGKEKLIIWSNLQEALLWCLCDYYFIQILYCKQVTYWHQNLLTMHWSSHTSGTWYSGMGRNIQHQLGENHQSLKKSSMMPGWAQRPRDIYKNLQHYHSNIPPHSGGNPTCRLNYLPS